MSDKPHSMKGEVVRLIKEGNPKQRLKSVEWGAYGEVRRVEWYDDESDTETSNQESGSE